MAMTWYLRLIGGDPFDPSSYNQFGSTPPPCPGTGHICAIYGTITEAGVDLEDDELQNQMTIALSTGIDQPRVLLRSVN